MSSEDDDVPDDVDDFQPRREGYGTRSATRKDGAAAARGRERWEDVQRSWELVTEGADGSLTGTVEGLLEAGKRRRILHDSTPLQRGIIRHVVLIIDLSSAMAEKDLRPTRYLLAIRAAADFVNIFFEQNPLAQLGIVGMRDGLAVQISGMSGNTADHILNLQALRTQEPKGNPSLQNALDMARAALAHSPSHGTREILLVFGALLSSDPGDIHDTIRQLVADSIRVAIIGLAARVAVCQEICSKTNETSKDDTSVYGVALDETHFRELLLAHVTPPATKAKQAAATPSLLVMGFPSRIQEAKPTLCACHGRLTQGGYLCSRCSVKVCSLPAQCPGCNLQLVQSTHLARSYHHLFPLQNYVEVSWDQVADLGLKQPTCFGCLTKFSQLPKVRPATKTSRASESGRYKCQNCGRHFCIDCDVLAHGVTHGCAGCLSNISVGPVEVA